MKFEHIPLWPDGDPAYDITRYIREGRGAQLVRPAMIVVPGGGYGNVCRATEGIPVADRFFAMGFNVFILNYHVAPTKYPEPQQDIFRAIRLIRKNAAAWNVNPGNVAAVGFSAGGHLVASAGTRFDEVQPLGIDDADKLPGRPDAILLAYPVITLGEKTHQGTANNICDQGRKLDEWRKWLSLENNVPENASPTFVWHTFEDKSVPYENSVMFAHALHDSGVPVELQLHPFGAHGMQLGYCREDLTGWPEQAVRFLKTAAGFTFPENEPEHLVYLTFDDAVKSHLEIVAPILQKYNFGATFFITRFSDEWRTKNEEHLLTADDILKLHQLGFSIGNHTWSHPALPKLDEDQICAELSMLNNFLTEAGVHAPDTFAYPGGDHDGKTASLLSRYCISRARTTENDYITKDTDLRRIPAWPMQGDCLEHFREVVSKTESGKAVCIVFHGVPDNVHRHVNTEPEIFVKCMEYLRDIGAEVRPL